ncbi:PKD domain-containing protein [Lentzea aerocolonigenes]|uniref:PKD domain-containing protein n=1 Tax=Lentzea aerocolonigenes TaxID=68170 RepID=UPI000695F408|nr:PKD domain-containing protein [Lentzea aerocolonigenes]
MKPGHVRIALAAVAALAAAVLVVGPGYEVSQERMFSGAVWLASGRVGEATLVDGASAEVKARVPVADAGTALTVTQQNSAALVLDSEAGAMRRVDGATEQVSSPVPVLPASDGLVVLPSPDAPRVADVHSGLIVSVDAATLTPRGEPERLAESLRPGSVVVDGGGRVWAIDDTTGDLVWLSDGQRHTRATTTKNGVLTITRGRPALVDPQHGTADLLDPGTGAVRRSLRPDLRADDEVVVSGSADSSRLLIAIPSRGSLISCSFETGSCAEPVQVGAVGAELGTPVEAGNHAVVPDHSTGQATVVDLATSRVIAQRQLFEQPTRFEMIIRDNIVFFNDPNGSAAGVLDLWGDVRKITKYAENPATHEPSPTPGQPTRTNDVTKVGQQKPNDGLGLPRQTGLPGLTAPAPEASITVQPGNRGVAGDAFELTLVLRSPAKTATRWTFGDGTEASGSSVRHSWSAPGVFTVRATATFDTGKRAEAETTVTVDAPGAPPQITALSIVRPKPVIGESVHFTSTTTWKPDSWEWTVTRRDQPAPEVTAGTAEFDHRFATPGRYTLALTVRKGSQIAQASQQFTVARGAVKAWGGENFSHELDVPKEAESGVIAISAADGHALALKADGRVIGWGQYPGDQRPVTVPSRALTGVVAISASGQHSLALKADGSVIGWGIDPEDSEIPPEARQGVIAISAGVYHSLALKSDHTVVAWGGIAGESDVPPAARRDVVAIAAGEEKSLVLKADGSIVTWGWEPPAPPEITGAVRGLAMGFNVGLALKEDGSVISWGGGKSKVLRVPEEAMSGVAAVDFHGQHALALKSDGTAVGWGDAGDDIQVVPPKYNSGVLSVAAGQLFSLVLLEEID